MTHSQVVSQYGQHITTITHSCIHGAYVCSVHKCAYYKILYQMQIAKINAFKMLLIYYIVVFVDPEVKLEKWESP